MLVGSKLDVITHNVPLVAIKFSEAGDLFGINLLFVITICVLSGIVGYVGSLCADSTGATRPSIRKMVTVAIYSVLSGLSLGMMLSLLIGEYGLIVAGIIVGLKNDSLGTTNYAKIWKAAINSFVCITRREKMKDEDF